MKEPEPHIVVQDLSMAFGTNVIQQNLTFTINRGDIFIVMGGSGCGKSTLMRHLIGLHRPWKGRVLYDGVSFWDMDEEERQRVLRHVGVMYQSGALWSSMTLAENIGLLLEEYTGIDSEKAREVASLKLALVGLAGFEDYYPSEISGGMKKRASIARAMALDPDILFLDEPSGGLDPISGRMLDDLILELRATLGTTIVVITHELASIFAIGTNSVFLDTDTKTMIASGDPKVLRATCQNDTIQNFLRRGEGRAKQGAEALDVTACPDSGAKARGKERENE
jgi:phospholipid/cholesterol/gamma-HCH transport system ATP-binding protein